MEQRLNKIFKIISFFDEYRWEDKINYNLINFQNNHIDDDSKILTHWFCYIADRQMPFKTIWDVGGFVFSELIDEMKKQHNFNLINPKSIESFVKKEIDSQKYYFLSRANANNKILEDYPNYVYNQKVKFKSRFLPADYFCILFTLSILEEYNYTFSEYIYSAYNRNKDKTDIISRILFSLYLLTYYDVSQPDSNALINFSSNIKTAKQRTKSVLKILNNENEFESEFKIFSKDKIFKQKRAWCSLRDFLKSPEFKTYFKNSLKNKLNNDDFKKIFSVEAMTQLELPGDVWNNNSKFRKCILKNTKYHNSNIELNKILRDHFENNKSIIEGYPEQFDITFNFVPNMCENNNCHICPIDRLNNINDFSKICVNNTNMFCPVALTSCNYKNHCKGSAKCKLISLVNTFK